MLGRMDFSTKAGVLSLIAFLAAGAACSSDPEPQTPAGQDPYGQGAYPGQGTYNQGTYGQAQGYPQGSYGTPAPATTATAAGTATSPSILTIPCQSDAGCGTHKCNLTVGACILPCAGPQDCAAGTACTMGVCVPGMGQ